MSLSQETAFPRLTTAEIAVLKPLATAHDYADGDTIFAHGHADIDLCVIESGQIDILNPTDGNRVIVTHGPGQFSGDIDLLTGRPVMVTAVARGNSRVWRMPGSHLRALLNRVPGLGEKLIVAFTRRRELLSQSGMFGLRVVGPGRCRDTNTVREFLYKNFVPFTWFDPETEEGQKVFQALGSPRQTPVIECGDGQVLLNPSLQSSPAAWNMEALPYTRGRFRDCRSRAGRHSGGRLCIVGRSLDPDARPAGTRRSGRRLVANRKLHRVSGGFERRGACHARSFTDAEVRCAGWSLPSP